MAFKYVANYVMLKYSYMIKDIAGVHDGFEGRAFESRRIRSDRRTICGRTWIRKAPTRCSREPANTDSPLKKEIFYHVNHTR
jgi:hypothetical protein